jgi:predicted nucleotidyltransferase
MMVQSIAPVYRAEIAQFCQRVEEVFHPVCVILHGSLARGTNTATSDVDIIVISEHLPQNFLERLYQLNRLRTGVAPLEVLGYTLSEWAQMLEHLHLTALEALYWGKPLVGEALFAQWKEKLAAWQAMGLERGATNWTVPPALRQKVA